MILYHGSLEVVEHPQIIKANRPLDLVLGPVANDNVYFSFNLYESGFITKSELISRLKTYKLTDQLLFHTERSLQTISFIGYKKVRR